jgi:aspartyl-tRNA(Asn)/glutamyl-tRNA(Gln) amidotransferase subunit A
LKEDRNAIGQRVFSDIDVLLLRSTTTTVPDVKQARGNAQALSAANTMFAKYFGLPAISIPCGFDRRQLPVGLQVVGRPWGEDAVVRLARQYETATDWTQQHPIA